MSALTDRIAQEHQRIFNAQFGRGPHCTCGWIHHSYDGSQKHVRHVAEVTEAAVREQMAREIKARTVTETREQCERCDCEDFEEESNA